MTRKQGAQPPWTAQAAEQVAAAERLKVPTQSLDDQWYDIQLDTEKGSFCRRTFFCLKASMESAVGELASLPPSLSAVVDAVVEAEMTPTTTVSAASGSEASSSMTVASGWVEERFSCELRKS